MMDAMITGLDRSLVGFKYGFLIVLSLSSPDKTYAILQPLELQPRQRGHGRR